MEDKMEEINTAQEHTRQIMITGFADSERSFEAAHTHNKDHFRMLEDDIKGVRHLIKDQSYKRKSDEMDNDGGQEDHELTDDENEDF
eukprot:4845311-Heterocapsa_arctica.AAC.1